MDFHLIPRGTVSSEFSAAIDQLRDELAQADIQSQRACIKIHGAKDGGLTIGLTIVGLALSGITTLLSCLSFWKSTRPDFTITVQRGDATITVKNLDQKEAKRLALELTESEQPLPLLIELNEIRD